VVSRFHLQLYERPRAMLRSVQLYPMEYAAEVLRWTMEMVLTPYLRRQ
jgi:hypothetical protein